MDQPFIRVSNQETLAQLFAASRETPVVLFQHDPGCGISTAAYRALEHFQHAVHLIDVTRQGELSQAIAQWTGIRHESPQVIILRNGRQMWTASHRDITHSAVERALTAEAVRV